MTNGFNYETMEWQSYEDFFHSFMSEAQKGGAIEGDLSKGLDLLYAMRVKTPTIMTSQESRFVEQMLHKTGLPKGTLPEEDCNRFGCFGAIQSKADSDMSCSCHNYAPCAKCMSGTYCPECDWDSDEDN